MGLFIGYIGSIGRRNKTILIYDAHEYELGRLTAKPRSKLTLKLIGILEKFLIKKSSLSIIVNKSIAEQMQEDYNFNFKHVIARNIPEKQKIDEKLKMRVREKWLKELNLANNAKLILYHGYVREGRGVEVAIKTCAKFKENNIGLIILGYGSEKYIAELEQLAREYKIDHRVIFHDAVSGNVLLSYVAAADIGLVLIEPFSKSYYFALPNKLFENIHAGNPVLASDLPEIRGVVNRHLIGITCDIDNLVDVQNKLGLILQGDNYHRYLKNIEKIKDIYTWEHESETLIDKLKDVYKTSFDF